MGHKGEKEVGRLKEINRLEYLQLDDVRCKISCPICNCPYTETARCVLMTRNKG
jgi:hypothetical protein